MSINQTYEIDMSKSKKRSRTSLQKSVSKSSLGSNLPSKRGCCQIKGSQYTHARVLEAKLLNQYISRLQQIKKIKERSRSKSHSRSKSKSKSNDRRTLSKSKSKSKERNKPEWQPRRTVVYDERGNTMDILLDKKKSSPVCLHPAHFSFNPNSQGARSRGEVADDPTFEREQGPPEANRFDPVARVVTTSK